MKIIFVLCVALLLVACNNGVENEDIQLKDSSSSPVINWRDMEIKDVLTGDVFKINDFDVPVIIESFAVWCPTCTKQQSILKDFHDEVGDSVSSISLDTDPNEDESAVIEHAESHGFNWKYVVSPTSMTQGLIDEFGIGVINAPSTPVVVVCPNGDSEFLRRGLKQVDELKDAVARCN